jgi:CHAD domain-containing protein
MRKELVLILAEETAWESIVKFFGKDFFPLDKTDEPAVPAAAGDELDSAGRIYFERRCGILVKDISRVRLTYDKGGLVAGGQEIPVRELTFTSISGKTSECLRQAALFAKKFKCLLESRSHGQRIKDTLEGAEFGRFHVKEFTNRTLEDALPELILWHLCGISQASQEFALHGRERLPARRLRVEIRKLRAVLTVFKSALLPETVKWREKLRFFTVRLSRLRELDVALGNWRNTALNRKRYSKQGDRLSEFLLKERAEELAKTAPIFALNKFTPMLIEMMEWLAAGAIREGREDIPLDKMAGRKLDRWYRSMQKTVKRYPDFANDNEAHVIRIKAKSARYIIQSMSGKAYGDGSKLTRSLKRLLDALGILHDNRVNEEIVKSVVKKENSPELIYQAGIFTGNERAQAGSMRKMLPGLWEKFAADWEKWQ